MGACSADYDNDGWTDLYVTAVGSNKLYHNTGKNGFYRRHGFGRRRRRSLELELCLWRHR